MKLTEHFTLEELTRSTTATRLKIDNTPPVWVLHNLAALAVLILEPLRITLDRPIIVNSGYRCPELNDAVGGVVNSRHLAGMAADLRVGNRAEGLALCDILARNPYLDKALFEHSGSSSWLHVQISTDPAQYINRNYVV